MYVEAQREPFHLAAVWERVGGECARKLRLLKASSRGEQEKTPIWMTDNELNCFVFFFPSLSSSWYDCRKCPADMEWRLTTISAAALSGWQTGWYTTQRGIWSPASQDGDATHINPVKKPEDGTDTARRRNIFCKSSTQTQSGPTAKRTSVQV